MTLWVTGFGPFGEITENPSAWIAERVGVPYEILDVSYSAVDEFLDSLPQRQAGALMMIGVAANRNKICLERVGANWAGEVADVQGIVRGPAPIASQTDSDQMANLWRRGDRLDRKRMQYSRDAGTYLCNYSLHEARRRYPHLPVGFLHIPPFETMPRDAQLELVKRLSERIIARFQ